MNRQFVFAMSSIDENHEIGQGESAAKPPKRFSALMKMPRHPKPNAYYQSKEVLLKTAIKASNDCKFQVLIDYMI